MGLVRVPRETLNYGQAERNFAAAVRALPSAVVADSTLILGVVGVIGTISGTVAGAVIAARSTASVERRKDEREASADAVALRGAARLVWLDIAATDAELEWAARRQRWHPSIAKLPRGARETYRDRLAVSIGTGEEWETVAYAMAALAKFRATTCEIWTEPHDLDLDHGTVASIIELRQLLIAAAAVLRPIAGLPEERPAPHPSAGSERYT